MEAELHHHENHIHQDDLKVRSVSDLQLVIKYFLLESGYQLKSLYRWSKTHVKTILLILLTILIIGFAYRIPGRHQKYLQHAYAKLYWYGRWVFLGILSSIGLGTGLHTFILYLGPHIAKVTLSAYECNSVNFPEPPYPDEIICPSTVSASTVITILTIVSKVRLESFLWGAGTAIGELPPYFMARAARLSGEKLDEEEDDEDSKWHAVKSTIKTLVERVGFLGILACASIPNPLFDFAGFACGHFLVPFWTFFGATLIGKAIIKVHIQMLFVIVAFNEHHFEYFVDKIKLLPYVGKFLYEPFKEFLNEQKTSLHRKQGDRLIEKPQSWLSWVFEHFVMLMVIYFVLTIVKSMANSYQHRLNNQKKQKQT